MTQVDLGDPINGVERLPVLDKDTYTNICKIGQKGACCRYLVGGAAGLECAKLSTLKAVLDFKVFMGEMTARGDNCEGRPLL